LVLILGYVLVNPKARLQGYIIQKQVEAKDLTLIYIIQQIQQNGYVKIDVGNESLLLVPLQQTPPQ